ncbi:MAG: hypothetical protein EHM23_24140 [Acidobacteria bacterium]|nr:MAG: hypothetical protein EHM23_24140 [Acidobacteriota bacterium]
MKIQGSSIVLAIAFLLLWPLYASGALCVLGTASLGLKRLHLDFELQALLIDVNRQNRNMANRTSAVVWVSLPSRRPEVMGLVGVTEIRPEARDQFGVRREISAAVE